MSRLAFAAAAAFVMAAAGSPARAEDISLQASLDRNVAGTGEQITYQLTLRGVNGAPNPKLPPMPNFLAQSLGTSRSVSFVNGNFAANATYSYVLVPRAAGKFVLGPAEVELNGKVYRSNSLDIEVRNSPTPRPAPPGSGGGPGPGANAMRLRRSGAKAIFVKSSADKLRPFVNQQVLWTFKFYQAVRTAGSLEYTGPPVSGFWSEELPPQRNYYETVNGVEYYVTELRMALFPTTPGRHLVGAASLRCVVQDMPEPNPNDPFSMLAGGQLRKVSLSTDPIPIDAIDMPPAPADYRGAVGRFSLEASVDRQDVRQNEPITLTVRIRGTGNIKTVPDPAPPVLNNFKQYPGESSTNLTKSESEVRGEKIVQTVMIPQVVGEYTLPPLSLTYFDPELRHYNTVRTSSIPVRVRAGATDATSPASGGLATLQAGPGDVRFIRTAPARWRGPDRGILKDARVWLLDALPVAGLLAGFLLLDRRDRLPGKRSPAKSAGRARQALRRLPLGAHASGSDFVGGLQKALDDYFSEMLAIPAGSTHGRILEEMTGRAFAGPAVELARLELEQLDRARFAPGEIDPAGRKARLESALRLLEVLEKERRRKRT